MYKDLEIVNKIAHKENSIKEVKDFSYTKNLTSAPITVTEFFEACKNYPILFAKDKNNDWFASVMLGFKENENIFVDNKGNWDKLHYVPAFVRRYPFVFVEQNEQQQLLLGVEKEFLSIDKKDEKRKLFDDKDENTEFLNNVLNFLNQYQNDSIATKEFIKQLDEWELLEEKVATIINEKKEQFNINGFYIVNEEKLKHLSKKKKEEICNKNATALITAHLISLSNIQKLGIK
ncbi:SapC family protein [Arcobacter aquimarinus]|uniref:SapC family protein n=1 Tax=Arcobacter aquimarinus TaxID=1315211 RepID=A0AAE7B1I2_9BACT|nr:SapC family protein [Arcobacter aquimarinus]QKE25753.1 SapC family protein [Arcobacter aquimarinus]RXI35188.1 hypothetical protein CP986_07505 [Arcobacter aquimarinus]